MKLRFWDLLAESVQLYLKLLPLMIAVYIVCYLPMSLLAQAGLAALLNLALSPLLHAFELVACQQLHQGTGLRPGAALKRALACFFPFLVTTWMVGLSVVVGGLLFILPGIYLAVRLSMALQAGLFEGRFFDQAVGRSFELTQGRFWLIFLLSAIPYLPSLSIGLSSAFLLGTMPGARLAGEIVGYFVGQLGLAISYVLYRRLSEGAAPPPLEDPGVGLNPAA